MSESRTKLATKNISVAMLAKIIDQILNFAVRTVFIYTLSIEYLGVNGLFTNILSFLSLAELGVGAAIIYLMYKPVAQGNVKQIKAYMNAYKKIYFVLGIVVFSIGISLTPFLNFFIADTSNIPDHLVIIYILYIAKTVSTYFFAYKQSIFFAHQKGYIVQLNNTIFASIRSVLEILFLLFTKNFIVYLIVSVAMNYVTNIWIALKADKAYPYLKEKNNEKITAEEKASIKKSVGAMFLHKIGAVVLNSSDNLILSKFIGIVTVGIYSNYATILLVVKTTLWSVFDAIVPSVGNLCAESDDEQKYKVFKGIQFMNLWISSFCTISLGILINPFITIWIGDQYLLPQYAVWAIIISYYIQTNMRAIEMFRSATGLFYKDRFVPLIQCVINIVVSIIMVQFWGVAGVFVGTTLSVLLTGFWVQPFMVFKYIFKKPLYLYFVSYLKFTVVAVIAFFATYYIVGLLPAEGIIYFVIKMVCCALVPNAIFFAVFFKTEECKFLISKVRQLFGKKGRKEK